MTRATVGDRRASKARSPPGGHRLHYQNARRWRCAVAEALGVFGHAVQSHNRQGVSRRQCSPSDGKLACPADTKIPGG